MEKKSESVHNNDDFVKEVKDTDLVGNDLAITPVKSEDQQIKVEKKQRTPGRKKTDMAPLQRKKTRQSVVFERCRVENNPALKLFSTMVNRLLLDSQTIRVQTDDNLFGYDSYTYVSKKDIDRVLNMEELTAPCITVYIM